LLTLSWFLCSNLKVTCDYAFGMVGFVATCLLHPHRRSAHTPIEFGFKGLNVGVCVIFWV